MLAGLHQPEEEEEEEKLTLGTKRAAWSDLLLIIHGTIICGLNTATSLSFVHHTFTKNATCQSIHQRATKNNMEIYKKL